MLEANSRFQITHSFPDQRVAEFHFFKPVDERYNMHHSNTTHDRSGSQSTGPMINFTNSNYLFYYWKEVHKFYFLKLDHNFTIRIFVDFYFLNPLIFTDWIVPSYWFCWCSQFRKNINPCYFKQHKKSFYWINFKILIVVKITNYVLRPFYKML